MLARFVALKRKIELTSFFFLFAGLYKAAIWPVLTGLPGIEDKSACLKTTSYN